MVVKYKEIISISSQRTKATYTFIISRKPQQPPPQHNTKLNQINQLIPLLT